jgi:hypothetical protein
MFPKTGKERVEVVYGVTSLRPERATPERLLALVRGQWQIENQSPWVRDVTFDEDRSQVRCGNIPQVMAALRNTTVGLPPGMPRGVLLCRRWSYELGLSPVCLLRQPLTHCPQQRHPVSVRDKMSGAVGWLVFISI